MTEKELKKLNRAELLEMLIAQSKKLSRVEAELAEAQEELKRRELAVATSGTLAEAALKLSGIFEAADKAAQQYRESLQIQQMQAESIVADARAQAQSIIKAAEEQQKLILSNADNEAKQRIESFNAQFREFLSSHT